MKTRCVLLFALIALPAMTAVGQTKVTEPDKDENIRHLLKITGVEKMQQNMVNQMLNALRPMLTKASNGDARSGKMIERMTELMTEEFKKADFGSITVDLYNKYFTNEDIKGLIQFYESPVGQKSVELLPTLTQESMTRGMAIGQSIVPKVMERLVEEFPELKSVVKPPPPKP